MSFQADSQRGEQREKHKGDPAQVDSVLGSDRIWEQFAQGVI